MKRVGLSIALSLLAAPIYAHHVPGPDSASVEVTVLGCNLATNPSCQVTLTTANGLNCRESTDGKRNVTCNLPQGLRVPAAPVAGQPQFEFTRTTLLSDPTLGAEFVALCNAVSLDGPCDNTTQYRFQNSTIRKVSPTTTTAQKVQMKMGFTLGLLNNNLNDSTPLSATSGFAHVFSSRGNFVNGASSFQAALNNTHSAAASFTYVLSSATCGTTSADSPEPFDNSACYSEVVIPCVAPSTDPNKGVTCGATQGDYVVKSSTLTSWNSITIGGKIDLQDLVQRTCSSLFNGNPTCRTIERGSATLTYGFVRQNDRVNITSSGVGATSTAPGATVVSNAEGLQCGLHESGGGTTVNPNDQGNFKVRCFGSAAIDTNTMIPTTTFFGLPGGTLIQATDIRYNQSYADSDGVIDEFPDVSVVFDSSDLAAAGITCAAYGGENMTFVLQSVADVTVSVTTIVQGKQKKAANFGSSTTTQSATVSGEIPAIVGPCNNP